MQYPKTGMVNGKVFLFTNGDFTESDLNGLSSKEIKKYCELTGFKCDITGTGYVSSYAYNKDETGKIISLTINLTQKYQDVIGNIN